MTNTLKYALIEAALNYKGQVLRKFNLRKNKLRMKISDFQNKNKHL